MSMKWHSVVIGVVLLLSASTLPVSAIDSLGFERVESNYLVLPLNIGDMIEPRSSIYSSVNDNGIQPFDYYVPSGSTKLSVRLTWDLLPDFNSLTIRILNPNGLIVVEESDLFENPVPNGIIPIEIKSGSELITGFWRVSVIGTDVNNSQSFNLIINSV